MYIYTSYYARLKEIEEKFPNILPVGISGKVIEGFSYQQFRELAPSWNIWKEWHDSTDPYKDYRYQLRFIKERLGNLNPESLVSDFQELVETTNKCFETKYDSIVMLCYETPTSFCHRHIVSEWIKLAFPSMVKGELDFDNKADANN